MVSDRTLVVTSGEAATQRYSSKVVLRRTQKQKAFPRRPQALHLALA